MFIISFEIGGVINWANVRACIESNRATILNGTSPSEKRKIIFPADCSDGESETGSIQAPQNVYSYAFRNTGGKEIFGHDTLEYVASLDLEGFNSQIALCPIGDDGFAYISWKDEDKKTGEVIRAIVDKNGQVRKIDRKVNPELDAYEDIPDDEEGRLNYFFQLAENLAWCYMRVLQDFKLVTILQ